MPVSTEPTLHYGRNDISRLGANAQPIENNNPAWQSNSKVGSRFRVEMGKATYTWKDKTQAGLDAGEIERLPILGSRGDFNTRPISKVTNNEDGSQTIHYIPNQDQRKTRYKSIKATEGALKRNNWVIYVQLALQSANSLIQGKKLKYPEVISDIVLQAMFHAKEGGNPLPVNPLMYKLFNPWTYSSFQNGDIYFLVSNDLNQNRNYFESIRNQLSTLWTNFCNAFDPPENPNPGLQVWERFGDHSNDLEEFIQRRDAMIQSNAVFNPSHRQIEQLAIQQNMMPGSRRVIRPLPIANTSPLLTIANTPTIPPTPPLLTITNNPLDEEPYGFDLPDSLDTDVSIQIATSSSQPRPQPRRLEMSKNPTLTYTSDLQGNKNDLRSLINLFGDNVRFTFRLPTTYSEAQKSIPIANGEFAAPIPNAKNFLTRFLNNESAISANEVQTLAAALFVFYFFSGIFVTKTYAINHDIVFNPLVNQPNNKVVIAMYALSPNHIVIYQKNEDGIYILHIMTDDVILTEADDDNVRNLFGIDNTDIQYSTKVTLREYIVSSALYILYRIFGNYQSFNTKIPIHNFKYNMAGILCVFGDNSVPQLQVNRTYVQNIGTANLGYPNFFQKPGWAKTRGTFPTITSSRPALPATSSITTVTTPSVNVNIAVQPNQPSQRQNKKRKTSEPEPIQPRKSQRARKTKENPNFISTNELQKKRKK